MKSDVKYSLLMALAAFIWGTAFVAQRMGAGILDAFSFNSVRSFIGALALIPVVLTMGRQEAISQLATRQGRFSLLIGGLSCGIILTVSTLFQQVGLEGTTAGKAGFITALYILIVPLIGLVFGKRVSLPVWLAVAIALFGMYCLCIKEGFTIERGDRMVLFCAFCFSCHILAIDHFVKRVDPIMLSAVQFFFCGIFSLVPFSWKAAPLPEVSQIVACWKPILYTAVFSSAVAYTLQIITQKHLAPTVASIVMSLESVFAALSGWVVLGEHLSLRELMGCALVFVATILAQVPMEENSKNFLVDFFSSIKKRLPKTKKKGSL